MSRASRQIRVTGERRDVIDTDRLAALLLRAAIRRETGGADTDSPAAAGAAPDSDTGDVEGRQAA